MAIPTFDPARPDLARSDVASDDRIIHARRVLDQHRSAFLPRVFGTAYVQRGEVAVYNWMRRLCADYSGGYWQFYDLSNGGFYLALDPGTKPDARLQICVRCGNDFEGELSYDAAGVVATLYAVNELIWSGAEHLYDAYYFLRDFAAEHAERKLILAAVD